MEQFGKELEKVLKAGIGAVKSGMELGADTIEKWAEKGEPIYECARENLQEAAGKIKKAVDESNIPENWQMMWGGKVTPDTVKSVLKRLDKSDLAALRDYIDTLLAENDCPCEKNESCAADDCDDACKHPTDDGCACDQSCDDPHTDDVSSPQ